MVCALVAAGKTVGVTANSHKVIRNFLDGVLKAAAEMGTDVPCIQKPSEMEADQPRLRFAKTNAALLDAIGNGSNVAGGTAWLWASPDAASAVDVLQGKRLDLAVIDLGPTQLKNIAEPVRAYSLQVGVPAVAKPTPKARPPEPKKRYILAPLVAGVVALTVIAGGTWYFLAGNHPAQAARLSIVVLPFANLSGDPAQDYFADGITENLTTDLSRIRNSFVIARNTAFTFKGRAIDATEIGKQLDVRYVLEGSVQRDQNRVRVNAQLINSKSGAHLWADRFDEDIVDLFKLQDEIVARLANSLGNELVIAEAQRAARIRNLDAFDLTMRGRALQMRYQQQRTKENNNAARAMYERALAIDPNDAGALAGEASTYMGDKVFGWADPDVDYDAKVVGLADRSIAIDPEDARPYSTKSLYLQTETILSRAFARPTPVSPSIQMTRSCMRRRASLKITSAISSRENPRWGKPWG